jgi:hypothetical protein
MSGDTPEKAERPVPHPFDYVTRDQIQDLWGIGYTIVKRSRHIDPFHVPPEMVPQGRSYQWWHLVQDKAHFAGQSGALDRGWATVPASRHDGYFMPFGHVGPIEVGGLGLFEKSKHEVDQEKAAQVAAARKQVEGWSKRAAAHGISGSINIEGQTELGKADSRTSIKIGDPVFDITQTEIINNKTKSIETTTRFPPDMLRHASEVLAERDRLYEDLIRAWSKGYGSLLTDQHREIIKKYEAALEEDPAILRGPTLNALLLPIAVETVRAKLKEGKTDE